MIAELSQQIEEVLKKNPQGLSEYELINCLQALENNEFDKLDLQDSLVLFQTHFVLFHCLYLLNDQGLAAQGYCLQISPMKICMQPYSQSFTEELAETDGLRDYYLDLTNLQNTDKEGAEQLINSFWQKYLAAEDRLAALAVLGLEDDDVEYEQIKQRYRQLAMENHPDRGGCKQIFSDIAQAMDTLKRYYQ